MESPSARAGYLLGRPAVRAYHENNLCFDLSRYITFQNNEINKFNFYCINKIMVSVGSYLIGFLFLLIICYALMKQSEELGWYRLSIGRQSLDEESVYLKNTKAEPGDKCKDLYERMVSILSYQEKGGAWKRCIIIATINTFFVYIVYSINNKLNNISHYAVLLLVIFTLQYFYQNYINYHHFRKLKQNGVEILQLIKQKCKK